MLSTKYKKNKSMQPHASRRFSSFPNSCLNLFLKLIWKFKILPYIFAPVLTDTYQERQRVMAR